ncbi:MAG: hypothetical protein GKS06_08235 [Acidobacteria bacterium]|nr:hypothetical protein [Acidobacteriota bacterium]
MRAARRYGWTTFGVCTVMLLVAGTVAAAVQVITVVTPPGATNTPGGIAVDADGNLCSADFDGTVTFRITPGGAISVFAQGLFTPSGNAFDSRGRYYQSNYQDQANPGAPDTIVRVNSKGTQSTFATGLNGPVGIAIDPADTLFVAMCNANQVWRVDQTGTALPFAASSSFNCPNGIAFDDIGDLYIVSFNNGIVVRLQPDGTTTDVATIPTSGNGHLVYVAGSLYITDRAGHRVYRVELPRREGAAYKVTAFAGSGVPGATDGAANAASLQLPNGIARNAIGDTLYVNQAGGLIRAINLELRRPGKPNKVRAVAAGTGSVELRWGDRDRREEGFLVQQAEGRRGDFVTVARVPWNTTSTIIDGLSAATLYQFRIVAANGTAESRPSKKVRYRVPDRSSGL